MRGGGRYDRIPVVYRDCLATKSVDIPTQPQRPSPPPVPDAYVKVAVVDESGKPVEVTQFDVSVRFDAPFDVHNFSYEATATAGRLFFLPAPSEYPGTISVTPKGRQVAAPLELTNEFVWTALADSNGVIFSHTFHVDTSSNLYLPVVMLQTPKFSDDFCNRAADGQTTTPVATRCTTWPAPLPISDSHQRRRSHCWGDARKVGLGL